MLKNSFNKLVYFVVCFVFMTVFDFETTNYIVTNINNDVLSSPFSFLKLNYVENTGAAFSIFQDFTLFLIIIAIIFSAFILYSLIKNISKLPTIYYFFSALLFAGIVCNTYERIAYGCVRDFFNLNIINFPIFNLSDVLINISVLAIIVLIIKEKRIKKDGK